ncbi:LLM class F420-dependent oxidoreductase [Pseudonocardia eucalypti]|uniref:LLM class F420-dependent oxidoreductase n=1 Tax=Pseudonocardia eucalypti TaxID=648755 RepID=A0ABP9PIL4_9PSEU
MTGTGIWSGGLRFGPEDEACAAAAEAERLGYSAVWVPDPGGEDLFPRLAALLAATSTITVATGILNLWMHEPAVVGARYAELSAKHDGRLLLGIGVSHALIIDGTHPGEYRKPLAKMREYLEQLDAADPPVPVEHRVLAALGPKMLELSRDRAAGAHPYLVTPEHTANARAALGPDKLLAPEQKVILETDPTRAREIAREALRLYFGLPNYVNNWLRYGFTQEDVAAPGSDRLVDALVAWGTEETIAARVAEHRDAGADHVTIQALDGSERGMIALPTQDWARLASALLK